MTGIPCIVDLAAMRDCIKKHDKDPKIVNPLCDVTLIIDHSIQAIHCKSEKARELNQELELNNNKERFEFLKWG